MLINCDECNKQFKTTPSRFKKNKHNCCSTSCTGKLNKRIQSKKVQKNCKVCDKIIYYKQSHAKQVVNPTCSRKCMGELRKTFYQKDNNPNSLKLNDFEKLFWNKAKELKYRASAKKLDFNLNYKELIDLYNKQKGLCYYSQLPLKLKSENNNGADYNVLSVDRLDSNKGYTLDNIVFCLNCINMFKAHHSLDDIKKVFKAISINERKKVQVNIKKLYEDSQLPTQGHTTDSGYDLYTHSVEDCGNFIKVHTGISIKPESGYWFMLAPRSSSYKKGLTLYNNLGIIDNEYTGEIIGIFQKTNDYNCLPEKGDRLLQLIPQELVKAEFQEVNELSDTERNNGGFGSTG